MNFKRQKGQVIPYVAIIILILAACSFIVYDVGRMTNARIQFQNAADAASLAAVAVKINKHHIETIMRTAMTQEAIQSQINITLAHTVLAQAIITGKSIDLNPPPLPDGQPAPPPDLSAFATLAGQYKTYANKGYKHAVKLHRERILLDAFNAWLINNAPTAVREAAYMGYLSNIQGYDVGDLRKNMKEVLRQNTDLIENANVSGEKSNISSIIYKNEAASQNGTYGKSYVEFEASGMSSTSGASLIKYFPKDSEGKTGEFKLRSSSASQLTPQSTNPINKGSLFQMNWYSPRIMAIEADLDKELH